MSVVPSMTDGDRDDTFWPSPPTSLLTTDGVTSEVPWDDDVLNGEDIIIGSNRVSIVVTLISRLVLQSAWTPRP